MATTRRSNDLPLLFSGRKRSGTQGYARSATTTAAPRACAYVPDMVELFKNEYPKPVFTDPKISSSPGVMSTTCQVVGSAVGDGSKQNAKLYRSPRSPPLRVDAVQLRPCPETRVLVVDGLHKPLACCARASGSDDAQGRRGCHIPGAAQCCLGCEPRPKGQKCARRDLHDGQRVA